MLSRSFKVSIISHHSKPAFGLLGSEGGGNWNASELRARAPSRSDRADLIQS